MEEKRGRRMYTRRPMPYAGIREIDDEKFNICVGSVIHSGTIRPRTRSKHRHLISSGRRSRDLRGRKDSLSSNFPLPERQKSLTDLRSLNFDKNRILPKRPNSAGSNSKLRQVPKAKSETPMISSSKSNSPRTVPRPRRSKSSPAAAQILTEKVESSEWNELIRSVNSASGMLTLGVKKSAALRTIEALDIAKSEIKLNRANNNSTYAIRVGDNNSSSSISLRPTSPNIKLKLSGRGADADKESESDEQKNQGCYVYDNPISLAQLTTEMKNSFETFIIKSTFGVLHSFRDKMSHLEDVENENDYYESGDDEDEDNDHQNRSFVEENTCFRESAYEQSQLSLSQSDHEIRSCESSDLDQCRPEIIETSELKFHGIPVQPVTPEIGKYVANAFKEVKCMKLIIEKELEDLKNRQGLANVKSCPGVLSLDSEIEQDLQEEASKLSYGDNGSDDPNLPFSNSHTKFIQEIENELKEIDSCAGWISNNILSKMETEFGLAEGDAVELQTNKIDEKENSLEQEPKEISKERSQNDNDESSRHSPRTLGENFDLYYSVNCKPREKNESDAVSNKSSDSSDIVVDIFQKKSTQINGDDGEDSAAENDHLVNATSCQNNNGSPSIEFCEGVPIVPSGTGIGREIRAWFEDTVENIITHSNITETKNDKGQDQNNNPPAIENAYFPKSRTGKSVSFSPLELTSEITIAAGSYPNTACEEIDTKNSNPWKFDVESNTFLDSDICKRAESKSSLPPLAEIGSNVSNSNISTSSAASTESFSTENSLSEGDGREVMRGSRNVANLNHAFEACGDKKTDLTLKKVGEQSYPSIVKAPRLVRLRQWMSRRIVQPFVQWFRRNSY